MFYRTFIYQQCCFRSEEEEWATQTPPQEKSQERCERRGRGIYRFQIQKPLCTCWDTWGQMKRVGSESDTFWSLSCQWRNMVFTQCNSRGVIIGFHKCAKIKHQTYLTYPSKKSSKLKIQHIKEKIYLDSRLVRTDSQYIGRFESVHLVRPVMLGAVFTVSHSTATVRCRLAVRKKNMYRRLAC